MRQSTGTWEWDQARAVVASWENKPSPPATAEPKPQERITIEDALKAFYSRAEGKGLLDSTLKKYRTFKKQLVVYANKPGIVYVDQLTIDDADRYYGTIKDSRQRLYLLGCHRWNQFGSLP